MYISSFSHSRRVYHFALVTVGIHDLCYSVYVNYVLNTFVFLLYFSLKLGPVCYCCKGESFTF